MANINISYDDMEATATTMDNGKDDIDGVLENVLDAVRELVENGFTTDVQSDAFKDEYEEVTNSLKDASGNIEDMAKLLRNLRDRWEEGDVY